MNEYIKEQLFEVTAPTIIHLDDRPDWPLISRDILRGSGISFKNYIPVQSTSRLESELNQTAGTVILIIDIRLSATVPDTKGLDWVKANVSKINNREKLRVVIFSGYLPYNIRDQLSDAGLNYDNKVFVVSKDFNTEDRKRYVNIFHTIASDFRSQFDEEPKSFEKPQTTNHNSPFCSIEANLVGFHESEALVYVYPKESYTLKVDIIPNKDYVAKTSKYIGLLNVCIESIYLVSDYNACQPVNLQTLSDGTVTLEFKLQFIMTDSKLQYLNLYIFYGNSLINYIKFDIKIVS